ncbi:23S rRNA (adenine(1618)-N(6))-methyltransferase RlmF [Ancylomarina longa]|uniref:Ribosomal RNA large subunit methyltransferase F n=1 Tax=Ancylomarina longa TaxID=2487017 RepID=A0A434AXE8_9BACT|nr:23S rRNA (adenine(1618)-N(6))-methyltransferase RlmF [Ancylomarina longa]RUT79088.1 23S rRNA (adenine(1618)-N(6))-methyltransferase RlmF [Ancylomarina longa]
MLDKKRKHPKEKSRLHERNKNRMRYDFKQLVATCPELEPFVILNKYEDESIDFANPDAIKMLNKAILIHFYGLSTWDIPENYLCPPIPGRADYIHHIADLLRQNNYGKIPMGAKITCLDIGVGANCIYPIIGNNEYGWAFIGSDIDPIALKSAENIVNSNPTLKGNVQCVLQENPKDYFYGVIPKDGLVDLSICNPPFHASAKDALEGNIRKTRNLGTEKVTKPNLNFAGKSNELWCDGGEERFVRNMIHQSKKFAKSCFWFSSLISKESNLKSIYQALKKADAVKVETIPMGQGNKKSRIVAWTFLTKEEQQQWKNTRWNMKLKQKE